MVPATGLELLTKGSYGHRHGVKTSDLADYCEYIETCTIIHIMPSCWLFSGLCHVNKYVNKAVNNRANNYVDNHD